MHNPIRENENLLKPSDDKALSAMNLGFQKNTVNQLIFAAINFRVFVFMGIFAAIYFRGLQNWTMQI